MSVFDKLAAIKQISFKDGEINLLTQRVMFIPNEVLINWTEILIKNQILIPGFYEGVRKSFTSGWAAQVKKMYGFEPRKYIDALIDATNLSGWGVNKVIKFDSIAKTGLLQITNPPAGMYFKGKVNEPVEHVCRALYAGGATTVFGEDIDWVETKCIAQGNPWCELAFGPRKFILEQYSVQKYQIMGK